MTIPNSWFSETKKIMLQFHQQEDPELLVMVDIGDLQQVEQMKDGAVLLFKQGGYAQVNESYDKVISRLQEAWKVTNG